jgi:preprotein translocase subunit SecG
METKSIIKSIFFFLIIFSIISLSLNQPSLEEDKKEDEPEMVVGYISLKFKVSQGMLLAPIKVGSPEQEMNVVLDIGSSRTWVSDQSFKKGDSTTYKDMGETEERTQYDFTYSGKSSTETFTLADKKLTEFKFLLADNLQNTKMQGALSLGHEYDSKHKSLVYEMSHVCNTFYNMFLFQFKDNDEGELLIGDITEDQKRKYQYINKCLFLRGGSADEQIKWRCELTQMFIGGIEDFPTFRDNMMEQTGYYISKTDYNKLIDVGEPVVFETIFDKIYVPKKTMEYLKENYLVNIVDKKKMCTYIDNDSNIKVTCSKDEVSRLKRLNFVLSEKTALAFPSEALFSCGYSDKCEFLIQFDSKYEGYIFGLPVFKLYYITFDYNNRDLIFFGKSDKYLVKIPFNIGTSILTVIIWILLVAIIIMLLGLALIYILRRKNRKRQEIEEQIYEHF